ncbi:MAG: hypothetical protein K0R17_2155 [Rariglobus sp.]|jgi:hypothetical protein|nr:hypothetical protein [Rariglobus sp.]
MKPRNAFLLRFLLPPLYAPIGLVAVFAVLERNQPSEVFTYLGIYILYAYAFAGLPALLFAFLLGRFARRRPGAGGRLMRATLLGFASGVLITAMFGFSSAPFFLPLGAAVGFAVEGTLVLIERPAAPEA